MPQPQPVNTRRLHRAQLELVNMFQRGELQHIWDVAIQTDLQFNLVRS